MSLLPGGKRIIPGQALGPPASYLPGMGRGYKLIMIFTRTQRIVPSGKSVQGQPLVYIKINN